MSIDDLEAVVGRAPCNGVDGGHEKVSLGRDVRVPTSRTSLINRLWGKVVVGDGGGVTVKTDEAAEAAVSVGSFLFRLCRRIFSRPYGRRGRGLGLYDDGAVGRREDARAVFLNQVSGGAGLTLVRRFVADCADGISPSKDEDRGICSCGVIAENRHGQTIDGLHGVGYRFGSDPA